MLPGAEQRVPTGAKQGWHFQNPNALASLSLPWLGSKQSVQEEDGSQAIAAAFSC